MFDFLEDKKPKKESFTVKTPLNKFLKKEPKKRRYKWLAASKIYGLDVEEFVRGYFLGYEEVLDLDDHFVMETGTVIHRVLQQAMIDSGVMVPDSAERSFFSLKYGFCGAIDGLVYSDKILPKAQKIKEEKIHLEIKSCTDHAYSNLVFPSDLPIYHRAQAEIYQSMLEVNKTLFCYVNRASYSMKCLIYEGTGELYRLQCEKSENIWKHIKNKSLPSYNNIDKDQWDQLVKDIVVPSCPEEIIFTDAKTTIVP